jgi:flavin-dependent dehydrogenase
MELDVAIVGGGPGGSTVGSILAKYRPDLRVGIFEREVFPREHVGESLLPPVCRVLDEIGAWEAVEAANFPVKIGATYKWGTSDELWDFNLLSIQEIDLNSTRPAKYEGWRRRSAFQVERSHFDKILLDRARELGVCVYEGTPVSRIQTDRDAIRELELPSGERVRAGTYIDASGGAGVLRRALGIETDEPPSLKNIAFWDYWTDASWAITVGTSATRVQVTSLGYGWIWVIPISEDQSSIGLVVPAEYYKRSGKTPETIYSEAVQADPRIAALLNGASRRGRVQGTRDWSFVSRRIAGENWYLVGEAAGFADPILAAGITMTMVGARECAYTILAKHSGAHNLDWLNDCYEGRQKERILQHIRFANYWYSANAHFTDLMEFTSDMATDAGFAMSPESAWQWLGTGGFISLETAGAGLAGHSIEQIRNLENMMLNHESDWLITRFNVFDLDLIRAEEDRFPTYADGKIGEGSVYRREGKQLPVTGGIRVTISILQKERKLSGIVKELRIWASKMGPMVALSALEALETMLRDGWVRGSLVDGERRLRPEDIPRSPNVDWNRDASDPRVKVFGV